MRGSKSKVQKVAGPGSREQGPVQIVVTATGEAFYRPAFRPRSWDRLGSGGQEVLSGLQHLAGQLQEMQEHLERHVLEARHVGASWDLIGWSVGTTGEAARQRWAPVERSKVAKVRS